jgi:transcriptional regulator with XRE-family HTH domain
VSDYAKALGGRLRAIRQQQGLSLHGVEQKSNGRWKAVVVGSYERGDRAVTVQRLAELAEFYGVPVTELLPGGAPPAVGLAPERVVLDLEQVALAPSDDAAALARFVSAIQARRGDYNGRVLTIRRDDLHTLAILYDESPGEVVERLIGWRVAEPAARAVLGEADPD